MTLSKKIVLTRNKGILATSFPVKSFPIIGRLSKNIWKNKEQFQVVLFNITSVRARILKS